MQPSSRVTRTGIIYAVAAYSFWGLGPVYFKAMAKVSALEVLAHRILWSFLVLFLFLVLVLVFWIGGNGVRGWRIWSDLALYSFASWRSRTSVVS
ncbi:MAG: hypothetical protein ABIF77_13975 [bacterium]